MIEIIEAITKLIPVIGGAIIGVAGGLVGTSYAHKLSKKTDGIKDRKIKLEQLVAETYEIEFWLKKQQGYYLWGGDEILELSPVSKIEAIQALHFPKIEEQVSKLSDDVLNYRRWLISGAQLRIKAKSSTPPKEHMDKMGDFYDPVKISIGNVVKKAKGISIELNDS